MRPVGVYSDKHDGWCMAFAWAQGDSYYGIGLGLFLGFLFLGFVLLDME